MGSSPQPAATPPAIFVTTQTSAPLRDGLNSDTQIQQPILVSAQHHTGAEPGCVQSHSPPPPNPAPPPAAPSLAAPIQSSQSGFTASQPMLAAVGARVAAVAPSFQLPSAFRAVAARIQPTPPPQHPPLAPPPALPLQPAAPPAMPAEDDAAATAEAALVRQRVLNDAISGSADAVSRRAAAAAALQQAEADERAALEHQHQIEQRVQPPPPPPSADLVLAQQQAAEAAEEERAAAWQEQQHEQLQPQHHQLQHQLPPPPPPPSSDVTLQQQQLQLVRAALHGFSTSLPHGAQAAAEVLGDAVCAWTAAFDPSQLMMYPIQAVSFITGSWQQYVAAGSPFDNFDARVRELARFVQSGQAPRMHELQLHWQSLVSEHTQRRRERDEARAAAAARAACVGGAGLSEPSLLLAPPVVDPGAASSVHYEVRSVALDTPGGSSGAPRGGPMASPPATAHATPSSIATLGAVGRPSSPPVWYTKDLAENLQTDVNTPPRHYSVIWDQGPQHPHELRNEPYTSTTLCERLSCIKALEFAAYGNNRGAWLEDLLTQHIWFLKSGRSPSSASSLLLGKLSRSMQSLTVMSARVAHIASIETKNVPAFPTAADFDKRILQLVHTADRIYIPSDRGEMLLVLSKFAWKDGQSAMALWHAMDEARIQHSVPPNAMCEQYLANITAVRRTEAGRGAGPENQTERWVLAAHVLDLVNDYLSGPSPTEGTLETVRRRLECDRLHAPMPLPPIGRTPAGKRNADAFPAASGDEALLAEVKKLQIQQQHTQQQLAALSSSPAPNLAGVDVAQGGAGGVARRMGGAADLVYIVSTGKIWPTDAMTTLFKFLLNPERADGKCNHTQCYGCVKAQPPITVSFEWKDAKEMNGGYDPCRRASENKGPRTLQPHETICHPQPKCFEVWKVIWDWCDAHPSDPDVPRFCTPIPRADFDKLLAAHRKAFIAAHPRV